MDYKTLAKGAIAALVHMCILTDDDSIMVLSEFERVREIERKRYGNGAKSMRADMFSVIVCIIMLLFYIIFLRFLERI